MLPITPILLFAFLSLTRPKCSLHCDERFISRCLVNRWSILRFIIYTNQVDFFFSFLERGGDRLIVWKYRERKKRKIGRSFFGRFDLVWIFIFIFFFFSFPKYLIFLLLIINSFFFPLLGKENLESFFLHDLIWFRYSLVFLFLFSYFFSRMEIYCCACDRCFIRINLFSFFL